jgi:CubicO group peptidase (beta-lactamase class C family)
MTDTDFYVPEDKIDRFAALYGLSDHGLKVIDTPKTSNESKPAKLFSGGGGLVSTISDYTIFTQMLLNKGEFNGIRLLGRKTVEFMTRNHISQQSLPIERLPGAGFGLGFAVMMDPSQAKMIGSEGEFWWSGAYNTFFWIDPKEDLIMILMTQFNPWTYYPIYKEFQVLVYQAIVD